MIHVIAKKQLRKQHNVNVFETTDVVHEAFLKLQNQNSIKWKNRDQFFAITTQIIRRILIDDYRAKTAKKRGGLPNNITIDKLSSLIIGDIDISFDLIEFDSLLKKLNKIDNIAAKVVELRFFGGLTQEETAQVCNLTVSEVAINWKFARSWLLNQLTT
jgi:RNA polymerase sigma factor (TIGR02999 family)